MQSDQTPGGAAGAPPNMDIEALTYTVSGVITSATSAGVGGLSVQVVDKHAGPDAPLAEATSDDGGRYSVTFNVALAWLRERNKTRADIQARVSRGPTFLAASAVAYNANSRVTLNVTLPADAGLESEYETLTRMLGAAYTGRLGDLQENGERTDITYLANKTGWDARAVALAALADQFGQRSAPSPPHPPIPREAPIEPKPPSAAETARAGGIFGATPWPFARDKAAGEKAVSAAAAGGVGAASIAAGAGGVIAGPAGGGGAAGADVAGGLHPAFYYALFRAGLPANAETLYRADLKTVSRVWTQAVKQGVIPAAHAADIPHALAVFQQHKAATLLDVPPRPNVSTTRALLQFTFGDDQAKQQQFATLYTQHEGDLPGFWAAAEQAFGAAATAQLKFDGQLALLTLNNASLMAKLHAAGLAGGSRAALAAAPTAVPTSLLDLVRSGYYDPAKWQPLLDGVPIAGAQGASTPEQRASFAALMAAQLRLSYPTATLAEMVNSGAVPLTNDAGLRASVYQFFTQSQGQYELGVQPLDEYLAAYQLTGTVSPGVVAQVKRLQRVYQITPSDTAMNALLAQNVDSAHKVVQYGQAGFVRAFQDSMGGADIAAQTFVKAQSVYNTVLNVTMDYLARAAAPTLGGGPLAAMPSTTPSTTPPATARLLEKGAGPGRGPGGAPDGPAGGGPGGNGGGQVTAAAATLEKLFGSLDFCACDECRSLLGPAAYLVDLLNFTDRTVAGSAIPQDVLFARRPDIQNLPLTCENANTALPYIDLVNETLEYYVANGSLAGFQGFSNDGSVTPEELSASPQNVNDQAYITLESAYFPPPLPFDRSLEYLRRLFQKFDIALVDAMTALRPNDQIERPSATAYGWRDILMERVGLSREEYQVLTDSTLTLQQVYGPTLGGSIATLSMVKEYARGMSVSYDDIVAIVKTRFINPNVGLIPLLEALDVPFTTIAALKNGTLTSNGLTNGPAFLALLPTGVSAPNAANYPPDIVTWVTDGTRYAQIMGIITLANPADPADLCSMDNVEFRYANPDNTANSLQPLDFVRLLRFIRLWRKLGLTIQQTDDLIAALAPDIANATTLAALDTAFLSLLPRVGFAYNAMAALGLSPQTDLAGALACWGLIATTGADSLYATMFLNPAVLRQDPAFARDANGAVLQDTTQKLLPHAPALCAAFNLTAAEFALIIPACNYDATTPLTLTTISDVYRRGWLARALGMSVAELLLLVASTGLDPFAALDPAVTPPAEPPAIRFIRLAQALAAASLKPTQALYLLWNQDISGASAPASADIAALALALRNDFAAVNTQFAIKDDPTGAIAKSLMTLVYGAPATNVFFGLINNTFMTSVTYSGGTPQAVLDATMANGVNRLSYDDFGKLLTFSGVLDATTLAAINGAIAGAGGNAALSAAVAILSANNQTAVTAFFTQYPDLQAAYTAYATSNDPLQVRRATLLNTLLPLIEPLRKQEQALADVTAAAGVDASFAAALLLNPAALRAASDSGNPPTLPGVNDFTAMEAPGLAAQFYLSNNTGQPPDQTVDSVASLSYGPQAATLPPSGGGGFIAAVWSGYITCPQDGNYDLAITTDAGTVTLALGSKTIAGVLSGGVWTNTDVIALSAGALTPITLTATSLSAVFALSWRSATLGLQLVPGQYLYSQTLMDHLTTTYTRFLKAAALATSLTLAASELAFLATDTELQVQGANWINALAVTGNPTGATAQDYGATLDGLLTYARLKRALAPKDDRLLIVLANPDATLPNGLNALLALTRWDQATRDALLQWFFGATATAPLKSVRTLARVYDAALVVKRCVMDATALLAAATNATDAKTVVDFEAAARARYAAADWLAAIKPVNDAMRLLQRDALVAYVLRLTTAAGALVDGNTAVGTPDTLFEYLLMDTQMDCCMLTSRLRLALSSVQLFIERCIRGLELSATAAQNVDPGVFKPEEWVWMKRYRVWEANREVFLWPENWLYPELRDDQSPFFKSIMSKLLQSDMSDDAASYAYLEYLADLEEVAKLEPSAICYVPATDSNSNDTAHVIARTTGAKRKYFYRSFDGANWGPWEPVPLSIEDNPLALAVWNNRLLLFWLQVIQTPGDTRQPDTTPSTQGEPGKKLTDGNTTVGDLASGLAATMNPTEPGNVTIGVNLFWSEYYNGKWHPAKSSDTNNPASLGSWGIDVGSGIRSGLGLYAYPDADATQNRLWLEASLWGQSASFCMYNTHSMPVVNPGDAPNETASPYDRAVYWPESDESSALTVWYDYEGSPTTYSFYNDLITPTNFNLDFHTIAPTHPLPADAHGLDWSEPFFYGETQNEFYVRTTQSQVAVNWYADYGILGVTPTAASALANLALKYAMAAGEAVVGPPDPVDPSLTLARVNPGSVERYITEDAYIARGLSSTGAVKYGGATIGVSGALDARAMVNGALAGEAAGALAAQEGER
jgi:hypothetical protein